MARIPVVASLRGWFVMRDWQMAKGNRYKGSARIFGQV